MSPTAPIAIAVSLFFLWKMIRRCRDRWPVGAIRFGAAACLVCIPLGSLLLLVQGLTSLVVLTFAHSATRKPTVHVCCCVVAFCVALVGAIWFGSGYVHRLQALRLEYSEVDLAARLTYEPSRRGDDPSDLSPTAWHRLERTEFDAEEQLQEGWRLRSLEELHSEEAMRFRMSLGFGVTRMNRWSLSFQELEDTWSDEPPKLPAAPADLPSSGLTDVVPPSEGSLKPDGALKRLYRVGHNEFTHPGQFGLVQSFRKAIGFRPHRVATHEAVSLEDFDHWRVTRLELVSLLKHDTPRVYVSAEVPNMEALRDVPTRPLTDFESEALEQLRTEEDLVVEETPDLIRMVGSLRASKRCLDCHNVRRGELLGAFSYDIHWFGDESDDASEAE